MVRISLLKHRSDRVSWSAWRRSDLSLEGRGWRVKSTGWGGYPARDNGPFRAPMKPRRGGDLPCASASLGLGLRFYDGARSRRSRRFPQPNAALERFQHGSAVRRPALGPGVGAVQNQLAQTVVQRA